MVLPACPWPGLAETIPLAQHVLLLEAPGLMISPLGNTNLDSLALAMLTHGSHIFWDVTKVTRKIMKHPLFLLVNLLYFQGHLWICRNSGVFEVFKDRCAACWTCD